MLKHRSPSLQTRSIPIKSVVEHETKLSVEYDFWLTELSGHPLPQRVITST